MRLLLFYAINMRDILIFRVVTDIYFKLQICTNVMSFILKLIFYLMYCENQIFLFKSSLSNVIFKISEVLPRFIDFFFYNTKSRSSASSVYLIL